MWKKTEPETSPSVQRPPAAAGLRPERSSSQKATIGPSITIKGDLTGEEDLVIEGTVDGEIHLEKHNVTVGRSGRIKADIYAKGIRVEGEVEGNLRGDEEIAIRASGRVRGNLVAPRVTLEDGSSFKGSIDMESRARSPEAAAGAAPATRNATEAKKAPKPKAENGSNAPSPAGPRPATARS